MSSSGASKTSFIYTGGVPDQDDFTHIIVQEGVTEIADSAFEFWVTLESISFPNTVKRIGDRAFHECSSLVQIICLQKDEEEDASSSIERIGESAFADCESLEDISGLLTESITHIGPHAFRGTRIRTVKIPSSCTTIDEGTFSDCSILSEIIMPSTVESISYRAFAGCAISSIQLGNDLIEIYSEAFAGCDELESIQIPLSAFVGEQAFAWSYKLRIVYTPAEAIEGGTVDVFDACHESLILLSDEEDFDFAFIPSITLNGIHQCLNDITNDAIPPSQQLNVLHQALQLRYPAIAARTQLSNMNLLHLLVYIPGNIYSALSTLLKKCPQAASAIDSTGKTALHHTFASTKQNMDQQCFDLLLQHSPEIVGYYAIQSKSLWHEVKPVVEAKITCLKTMKDEESGLLPFMMMAVQRDIDELSSNGQLTGVYELLCMQPDVLKSYS